jgi:hypothetical protein
MHGRIVRGLAKGVEADEGVGAERGRSLQRESATSEVAQNGEEPVDSVVHAICWLVENRSPFFSSRLTVKHLDRKEEPLLRCETVERDTALQPGAEPLSEQEHERMLRAARRPRG